MKYKYTGRKIAIFTDIHGLLEPMEAAVNDIRSRDITEIYSLGDNIGVGPCPCEVIDMLECYNIKSVAGNSEEYCTLGIDPFSLYFDKEKYFYHMWTISQLGKYRLEYIKNFCHSYDLILGGKKIALCHFANDVRTDYGLHTAFEYLNNFYEGNAYKQFFYTNSTEHLANIKYNIEKYGCYNSYINGYLSARDYPIFDGKTVSSYDYIFQGHVHKNLYEYGDNIGFYSLRALGLHFDNDPIDLAFYVVLHEKINNNGFDVEKVYVPFDRGRMEDTINKSHEPTKKIKKMVKMV